MGVYVKWVQWSKIWKFIHGRNISIRERNSPTQSMGKRKHSTEQSLFVYFTTHLPAKQSIYNPRLSTIEAQAERATEPQTDHHATSLLNCFDILVGVVWCVSMEKTSTTSCSKGMEQLFVYHGFNSSIFMGFYLCARSLVGLFRMQAPLSDPGRSWLKTCNPLGLRSSHLMHA